MSESWVLPSPSLLPAGSNAKAPLTAALGRTPFRRDLSLDLTLLPHLAVVGTSGSGKSTLIRTVLASLLMVSTPDDLQLILIDVTNELDDFAGVPHLTLPPIDDAVEAADILEGIAAAMDARYAELSSKGVRNITDYNKLGGDRMPRLLCVVDEFAALMLGTDKQRVERAVGRLGIRGRKCGIHLLLATQVPHATVLTPVIKANMAGRIALALPSAVFSRVALDEAGAEKLRGRGDALLRDGGSGGLQRFQTTFVSPEELGRVVKYWRAHPVVYSPPPARTPRRVRPPRRRPRGGRTVAAGLLLGAAVFGFSSLSFGSTGCPAGTTQNPSGLIQTCDSPSGATVCDQWASGFTPIQSEAGGALTYASTGPDGPWCAGATSPPDGE